VSEFGALTEVQFRALIELQKVSSSASNLGCALWGNGTHKPQNYAPAGRLLQRLLKAGLVERYNTPTDAMWKPSKLGLELLGGASK